ncbi:MAG: DNA polymerase/3'-5' exonuclease PolX [Clostridia bacterium]|nr:DNA polymerase/3'-5' exonuclease PolX [Clostridia bacterium]
MEKSTVVRILNEIAVLLELKGENPFKVKAYQNGARTLELINEGLEELVHSGRIKEVKGIGKTLAENITELVTTGELGFYQELKNSIPPGLLDIIRIPGLGPKKAYKLYQTLGISSIAELEYACRENRLIELKGFGLKSQENILKGIEHLKKFQGQFIYGDIFAQGEKMVQAIVERPEVLQISLAGSLRRFKEVVKDIDIVASSREPEKVMEFFIQLSSVGEVISRGETKTSVVLNTGINVDLRVVAPDEYYSALHHFTGSKEHNAALRQRAKAMGIKINEYGLFKEEKRIEIDSEAHLYQRLGMSYIPPELRENMGEIEAAEKGQMPELINLGDIQGVFHIHTNYSDGIDTLEALVTEAKKAGLKYLGISDHSQSAVYAGGLKIDAILKQREEIKGFNAANPDFFVFHGIEADILADGSLDYPDEILKEFDFVIASVHSGFSIAGERATRRLIKAMENPYVTMLGHPTGRILLGREGYNPDLKEIIDAAVRNRVIIELNASPYRLDLDWRYLKYAKEKGALISINPDAHRKEELYDLAFGVKVARKGWLEKKDVFNAFTVEEVKNYLKKKVTRN